MALSEEKILALQIDYELGEESKSFLCKKHRISRPTLRKHAYENGWIYQKNFQEVSNVVRNRVIEKIVERRSEDAIKTTEIFIENSAWVRKFVMEVLEELKKNTNYDKTDLLGFNTLHRTIETAAKTITNLYATDRKALGLDRDDDVEKARRVKKLDQPTEQHDPTENLSEAEVDKLLDEIDE